MKTNTFKKVTAILLSTTMMLASGLTVFASSADPDTDPDRTTEGTGNILDYRISTVVVPTAFKLAVNPNGYEINLRYKKLADDAAYGADTKYYEKKADGTYAIKKVADATEFASLKASLYTADVTKDQIATFNYGIASKATLNRKVAVDFAVSADGEIEFVGTKAEATAQTDPQDPTAAKPGEYKIYLALTPAGADATITTDTMAKATAWTDADTEYYTWDAANSKYSDTGTKYSSADDFKGAAATADLFVKTATIGPEIKSKELGDVTVSADSSAPIAFTTGKGTTSAGVTFVLPKATRALKATEFIDTDTDLTNFADKFELTAVTGVSSFTIKGTMNENAQWNKLTTKAITVTPTYDVSDATGFETAVDTGKYQVESDAKTYTVTYKPNFTPETGSAPADIEETVTVGEKATGKKDGEDITFEREGYTLKGWGTATDTAEADKVTVTDIDEATTLYAIWEEDTVAGTAKFIQSGDAYYLVLAKAGDTAFDTLTSEMITEVSINDVDVKSIAIASSSKKISLPWTSLKTALGIESLNSGDELAARFTVDGTTYTASYTKQ